MKDFESGCKFPGSPEACEGYKALEKCLKSAEEALEQSNRIIDYVLSEDFRPDVVRAAQIVNDKALDQLRELRE